MYSYDDDAGLAGSILIYAAAIVGALLVLLAPVYFANTGTVYPNSGVRSFDQILSARGPEQYPIARLERRSIVDPAVVAALNKKARDKQARAEGSAPAQSRHSPGRERSPRYAEAPPPRNPFSLFFSLF